MAHSDGLGSAAQGFEKASATPDNAHKHQHRPRPSHQNHNHHHHHHNHHRRFHHDESEKATGCCSPLAVAKTLIFLGVLFVLVGVLYGTVLPKVIDKKIKAGVVTCSLADTTPDYFDPYADCEDCTPYYYTLRMFNVTNAEAHLATGAKLALQESGAYVYRRRQIRVDVSFDNNRVSYRQYTYHTFEPELSCAGCKDTDVYVGYDVGYLSVLGAAGGEFGFLTRLASATFAKSKSSADITKLVRNNGTKMMRWVNGLNSLDPVAMKNVVGTVATFLLMGPDSIAKLDLSGFSYNGLFARRTIKQWAHGYPSMLAGIGLGSSYVGECTTGPKLLSKCQKCTGAECAAIFAECNQCRTAAAMVAVNNVTCGAIESIMAAKYGAAEAKTFVSSTCQLCTSLGLCAAPIPGIVEGSGMDWSKTAPPVESLGKYVQRTGCDDLNAIGEYEVFDGAKSVALWAKLDKRRNPTLSELMAFAKYGNCDSPTANLTCSVVQGADGQSLHPGGASMKGFASSIPQESARLWMSQGNQDIGIYNKHEELEYEGIPLHRFTPSESLLTATAENAPKGTGYPVDGVQPLGFTTGFLSYVSYPLYLYGNKSLLDALDIKLNDGTTVAKYSTMYTNGKLNQAFYDKYMTYLDIEAGTGKTMRARKRLQASYALSKSAFNASAAMTDVVWPKLPTEVIVPAYWGEESATVGATQISTYTSIKKLLGTLTPALAAGVVVGLVFIIVGCVRRRGALARSKGRRHSTI